MRGSGLVCSGFEDNGEDAVEFTGSCKSESCDGTADPDATQDTGTIRVTICHRTCSETNPWVRITIDDDAWGGADAQGCGHRQHSIEDECSKYGPDWAAWGTNHEDYELKVHGTREQVRGKEGFAANSAAEKAYWREWEHACPYVRGEGCCSWEDGSCCGINPSATEPEPDPQADPQADPEPDLHPDPQPKSIYVSPSDCDEDETACFSGGKPCTGREDECCDGLGCYGYNFYKVCKETPDCLGEWHDCSGGMDCCDGMVCVTTDSGMLECETPTIGTRGLRQAQGLHASS
jgi:hypothetical protein